MQRLKADRAGIVTAVSAEPGQVVGAGQPIVTVADAGETEIALAVPSRMPGAWRSDKRRRSRSGQGRASACDGRVREIGGQADPASRTYPRAHCRCRAARGHAAWG